MNLTHLVRTLADGLIYLLIGPFTVIGTVPILLMQLHAHSGLPHYTAPEFVSTGYLIMNLGALLAIWSSWQMFASGGTPIPSSPATRLVRSGPYAHVRHPMMHSLLIVGLGEVLVTGSPLMLLWIPVAVRAGILFVAHYEEPVLLARFGEEYAAYCREVPRWVPRWVKQPVA